MTFERDWFLSRHAEAVRAQRVRTIACCRGVESQPPFPGPALVRFVTKMATFASRAKNFTNPTAIRLLELMERKRTNLSVSPDVASKKELLALADALGPYICVFKV